MKRFGLGLLAVLTWASVCWGQTVRFGRQHVTPPENVVQARVRGAKPQTTSLGPPPPRDA